MKLKIQQHKIVFKLSQAEKKNLTDPEQFLMATVDFPNQRRLSYTLILVTNEKADLRFVNNEIQLHCPYKKFAALTAPSKQGIRFQF